MVAVSGAGGGSIPFPMHGGRPHKPHKPFCYVFPLPYRCGVLISFVFMYKLDGGRILVAVSGAGGGSIPFHMHGGRPTSHFVTFFSLPDRCGVLFSFVFMYKSVAKT